MGIYDRSVEVARRTMVLFFVVDCSGSMSGAKIGTVNSAIEEIVPELRDTSENNADAQIKIATLAFSTGAEWIHPPIAAENFNWTYLDAYGVTDLGEACNQLNEKLSKNAFMGEARGSFAPAIFLLSDGEPTDDYKHGLEKLKKNNWFKKAIKVAIAIGNDANKSVLADFTGNSESVITVHSPEALKKWIKFVSVRSSEIGSKSSSTRTESHSSSSTRSADAGLADGLTTSGVTDSQPNSVKAQNSLDSFNWSDWDNVENKNDALTDAIKNEMETNPDMKDDAWGEW